MPRPTSFGKTVANGLTTPTVDSKYALEYFHRGVSERLKLFRQSQIVILGGLSRASNRSVGVNYSNGAPKRCTSPMQRQFASSSVRLMAVVEKSISRRVFGAQLRTRSSIFDRVTPCRRQRGSNFRLISRRCFFFLLVQPYQFNIKVATSRVPFFCSKWHGVQDYYLLHK